jgi:hypothetical protein
MPASEPKPHNTTGGIHVDHFRKCNTGDKTTKHPFG